MIVVIIGITGCTSKKQAVSTINIDDEKNISIENLEKYFTGYDGTFVLLSEKTGRYIVYNEEKSALRVAPCSTFKLANALIGLETGVVKDENSVYEWDGEHYVIDSWNKNHSLSSAMKDSVVWYYKKLAKNIGTESMQNYIDKFDYGNKDISGGLDGFWLQSTLAISPMEQINFLRKLHNDQLPVSKKNMEIVRGMIFNEQEAGLSFAGKTGAGVVNGNYVNGWFIGYIEKEQDVFYFATNITADKEATGIKAKEITIRILKDKQLIH